MTQTRADRSADLTSGPMLQKIILFSIPLAASSILQLLFNAADVVVVGRFAGSTALARIRPWAFFRYCTCMPLGIQRIERGERTLDEAFGAAERVVALANDGQFQMLVLKLAVGGCGVCLSGTRQYPPRTRNYSGRSGGAMAFGRPQC